jgi:hypothetical protein
MVQARRYALTAREVFERVVKVFSIIETGLPKAASREASGHMFYRRNGDFKIPLVITK